VKLPGDGRGQVRQDGTDFVARFPGTRHPNDAAQDARRHSRTEEPAVPRYPNALIVLLSITLVSAALPIWAATLNPWGEFVFDINSVEDMRAVGQRAGIVVDEAPPMEFGRADCGRWASYFNVFPYQAVAAGKLPGRPGLVWICSGNADNTELSRAYCKQLGMSYVKHEGSVVTCRSGKQA
jgi:hypothetical protein